MLETVICTISDAGTKEKNAMVGETLYNLRNLRNSRVRITGIHMSNDVQLNKAVFDCCPNIRIIPAPAGNFVTRTKKGMENLFTSVKWLVRELVTKEKPKAILYMEGDKYNFVPEILKVIDPILSGSADVVIPERSQSGFKQYPLTQRFWENLANSYVDYITGSKIDRMYGPRAWSSECAMFFANSGINDFSALTYSVVRAELEGKRVLPLEVPGFPQDKYMLKYPLLMRLPGMHFLYRAMQNNPHKGAAELAKKHAQKEK